MGFLKKLFGTAAVVGAAAGSALYVKKRKDTRETKADDFDDFDDTKAFEFNKNDDSDGNTKVTITINKKKVKKVADDTADMVIDAADKFREKAEVVDNQMLRIAFVRGIKTVGCPGVDDIELSLGYGIGDVVVNMIPFSVIDIDDLDKIMGMYF